MACLHLWQAEFLWAKVLSLTDLKRKILEEKVGIMSLHLALKAFFSWGLCKKILVALTGLVLEF